VASSPSDTPPETRRLRLLLDQGFPKPPRFNLEDVDSSIEAVHLYDFDKTLSENSTPDWYLYCRAAEAGLDALVTRDFSQAGQELEMYVLTRLRRFVVLAWRKRMDDPVREWGQLLAYLPEIKKRLAHPRPPKVVFLPDPSLTEKNFRDPVQTLGEAAADRGISVGQVRREAREEVTGWLDARGELDRFTDLLQFES
jgi:hypothetical protein